MEALSHQMIDGYFNFFLPVVRLQMFDGRR